MTRIVQRTCKCGSKYIQRQSGIPRVSDITKYGMGGKCWGCLSIEEQKTLSFALKLKHKKRKHIERPWLPPQIIFDQDNSKDE